MKNVLVDLEKNLNIAMAMFKSYTFLNALNAFNLAFS